MLIFLLLHYQKAKNREIEITKTEEVKATNVPNNFPLKLLILTLISINSKRNGVHQSINECVEDLVISDRACSL